MSKQTEDAFIGHTLDVWQPRSKQRLTHEDARQMVENVAGFFQLLIEWDKVEHQSKTGPSSIDPEQ